jgi:2-desacetyl-2-hydroxyethyl bacteriochlorophyllide A dehydrogenase
MRQIVLEQPGRLVSATARPPGCGAHEALVRVHRVGVCGTDQHAFEGRQPYFTFPRILGHELAVEVIESPPNARGIGAGTRCAVEPYLECGECHACRIGKTNCCERLRVLGVHTDGGMRGWLALPVDHLHPSPILSFDQLVLVEPLSIGAHAVTRSQLQPGEAVLVVGAGPIGWAAAQFALAAGGRVRVLEIDPGRRQYIEKHLGVETLAEPDDRRADVVIDATGNLAAMERSFDLVAHGGRLVLVGLVTERVSFNDPDFNRKELTVLASRNSVGEFPRIIRLLEQGQISSAPWITHRMALAEVPERFPRLPWREGCLKAVIEVGEDDL